MNPTYKGRQELPDNLKALFRPVAMMVPDYKLIAEILLYSFGFKDSTWLSNKLVDTFNLCSQQLSDQFHYDYGMRAVKSTIAAAGLLKRNNINGDESEIVLKALIDINLPKFLEQDIMLFQYIISDLFPKTKKPEKQLGLLTNSINDSIKDLNLSPIPGFVKKI